MPLTYNPFTGVPMLIPVITSGGGSGGGQTWKVDRVPVETPDGEINLFTLPSNDSYIPNSLSVILNGQVLTKSGDYSETSSRTFTLVLAPHINDIVRLNYRTA